MVETDKVKVGDKTVNRKVRDVVHITANSDYFKEAVKSWRGIRPLFHNRNRFRQKFRLLMKPNAHSETYWDEHLMANHIPMLEYADFYIEAKFKEVAVQGFYTIKEEEHFSGEDLLLKEFNENTLFSSGTV